MGRVGYTDHHSAGEYSRDIVPEGLRQAEAREMEYPDKSHSDYGLGGLDSPTEARETPHPFEYFSDQEVTESTAPTAAREAPHPFEQISEPELRPDEFKRYGRQMILPGFGLQGQLSLKNSSVLIVGLGGLGCPAAAYIAGAGVGKLGLIDGDVVELSNLHRQVLHNTKRTGLSKTHSAHQYLTKLNPNVTIWDKYGFLHASNAVDIFKGYDLILDCTDSSASRYLISDAAVLAGKPLISASALGREGQLLILNNPPADPKSFCYRCVFPRPPPPDSVLSCGEGGILGPVVGTMGTMMATHTISILAKDRPLIRDDPACFWIYDPFSLTPLRAVRIKGKRETCISCSPTSATITRESLLDGTVNYTTFCGAKRETINLLSSSKRVSPSKLKDKFSYHRSQINDDDEGKRLLIDVQEPQHHSIATLPLAINLPISTLRRLRHCPHEEFYNIITGSSQLNGELKNSHNAHATTASSSPSSSSTSEEVDRPHHNHFTPTSSTSPSSSSATPSTSSTLQKIRSASEIYFICRHGNDSQEAVLSLRDIRFKQPAAFAGFRANVRDVKGGIEACRRELGLGLPEY